MKQSGFTLFRHRSAFACMSVCARVSVSVLYRCVLTSRNNMSTRCQSSKCVKCHRYVKCKEPTHTLTLTGTYHGTHSIFTMPAKALAGTELIPLSRSDSVPRCVGQEPDRTNGAPTSLPLKVQPPNATVQGKAEAALDAARSPSASMDFLEHELPILLM